MNHTKPKLNHTKPDHKVFVNRDAFLNICFKEVWRGGRDDVMDAAHGPHPGRSGVETF